MNDRPLVSIITVCRNAEATIERTLQSVMAQTYAPIEYIVIDGASTDATLDKVKACPAVTSWVSESDNGIADAFNKGLALARGEWIGILNADDWYEANTVETIVRAADGADIIHGPVCYWDGETPKEVYYPNQDALCREMSLNHPSVFVRRSVYETAGGFDVSYKIAMDYELLLRLFVAGYRFRATAEGILANMQFGGMSDTHWHKGLFDVLRAKNTHFPARWLSNHIYFCMQLLRGHIRRVLEKMGLTTFVRWFRERYSPMVKR